MFIIVALIGPLVSVLENTEASLEFAQHSFKEELCNGRSVFQKRRNDVVDLGYGNGVHAVLGLVWASPPQIGHAWFQRCGEPISGVTTSPFRAPSQQHCQGVSRDYDMSAGIRMQKPGDIDMGVIRAEADGLENYGRSICFTMECCIIIANTACKELVPDQVPKQG